MAIIKNSGMDNARKSVGMLTYRVVNGQTIVSQRITENKSKTPEQQKQRSGFGTIMKIGANLKGIVNIGFDPQNDTKRIGVFVRTNSDLLNYLKQHQVEWQTDSGIDSLPKALGDPTFFGRIIAAKGGINAQSKVRIDAEGFPEGYVMLSRPFREGDKVTLYCHVFYQRKIWMCDRGVLQETVLGTAEVAKLTALDTFAINRETFPGLRSVLSPSLGSYVNGVVTVVVQNGGERSTACFSLIASADEK